MGSRREEERNEKIIRGLMKLPPNRRCINCNSLGPQYVCTNFWTFVCITCSGIHREFTHRVKSVSMSKFTSQEVDTLQNGGNQRARETFLKNWDAQRQRLPDNSNADKVREFIKNVYEKKKYEGGKPSDKPPRDSQNNRSSEDVRRASSYHSYSQSPPYDYQYEERRYGKQASGFTSSKSTSERGYGKTASTFYSPGRFSDHMFEDSFANDGSSSRASDFSVSATQSPKLLTETEFSSPTFLNSKNLSSKSSQHQTTHQTTNLFPDGQSQRTASFESVRSFDSSSMSIKSCNYKSEQSMGNHQGDTSTVPSSTAYGGLDLFDTPATLEANATQQPTIDLFKLPEAPVDPSNKFQPLTKLFSSSSDHQTDEKSLNFSVPKNDGWATFDNLQPAAPPVEVVSFTDKTNSLDSSLKLEEFEQHNTQMPWPPHQSSNFDRFASSTPNPWLKGLHDAPAPALVSSTLSWNAFDDTAKDICIEGVKEFSDSTEVATYPSSSSELHLGSRFLEGATTIDDSTTGLHFPAITGPIGKHVSITAEEVWPSPDEIKSTNPFDFPYDSELEYCNTFLDMGSLQAAVPVVQAEPTILGGISQPWFPQDPVAPCFIPAQVEKQAYMGVQGPASQLQSVPTEGHVASIGGNPFA